MLSLLLISGDRVVISFWDGDGVVGEFKVVICGGGFNSCPEHLDVHSISVDEGVEDVEVLSCRVEPDDDCSIFCAECDDDGTGEIAAVCWEGGGVGHGDGIAEESGDVDRNWAMSSSRYGCLITCMAVGCRV